MHENAPVYYPEARFGGRTQLQPALLYDGEAALYRRAQSEARLIFTRPAPRLSQKTEIEIRIRDRELFCYFWNEGVQLLPQLPAGSRQLPAAAGMFRKLPEVPVVLRKLPETFGNITKNNGNLTNKNK